MPGRITNLEALQLSSPWPRPWGPRDSRFAYSDTPVRLKTWLIPMIFFFSLFQSVLFAVPCRPRRAERVRLHQKNGYSKSTQTPWSRLLGDPESACPCTRLTEMRPKQQQQQHEHHAPEVVHPDYPEAVAPQQYQQQYQQQQPQFQYNQPQQYQQYQQFPPNAAYKPEDAQGAYPSTAYSGSQLDPTSPRPQNAVPGAGAQAPGGEKKKGTICGCTSIVFVLCAIIALLSAAVIGLAAGTGVEASRANSAENRAAELSSSLASATEAATATGTAGSSSATSTSFAALDRNCSADPTAVTGTTYDAFSCKFGLGICVYVWIEPR